MLLQFRLAVAASGFDVPDLSLVDELFDVMAIGCHPERSDSHRTSPSGSNPLGKLP